MKFLLTVVCFLIGVLQSSAQVLMYSTTPNGSTREPLLRIDGRYFSTTNKFGSRVNYVSGYPAAPLNRTLQLSTSSPSGTFRSVALSTDIFGTPNQIRFLIREGQHIATMSDGNPALNEYWSRPILSMTFPQIIAGIMQEGYLPDVWTPKQAGINRHIAEVVPAYNQSGQRIYQIWTVTPNGTRALCKYVFENGIIYKTTPNSTRGIALYKFLGNTGDYITCSGTYVDLTTDPDAAFEFDNSCSEDGNFRVTWESCGMTNVDIRIYEFTFSGGQCECEPGFIERGNVTNVPAALGSYVFNCLYYSCVFDVEINESGNPGMGDSDTYYMPCKQNDIMNILAELNPSFSPNPVSGSGTFTFNAKFNDQVHITILNSNGELSSDIGTINVKRGDNAIPVSTDQLPSGAYFIRVSGSEGWSFVVPISVIH